MMTVVRADDSLRAHHRPDTSVPLIDGTVGDALRRAARRWADRRALNWAEGAGLAALTYAELLIEAERVAAWLLVRGVPGDRVAIWSRNSVDWVIAEYGTALAGMVVASWNPGWIDYECALARDLTQPVVILAGRDTRGIDLSTRARTIGGERTFALDDLRTLAVATTPQSLPTVQAADLFLIQFTSGTTGRAKGAALSHRAAVNAAWLRCLASGADETDVWLNASPMSHVGGAISTVLGAMISGSCYVAMHRFDAGEFLRLMGLSGATRIGGVPTMLIALLDHPDWQPGSVRLRSLGAGGAQVSQALVERLMREFAAPVLVAYGQSECSMIASSMPGGDPQVAAETVGRPLPHIELVIRDARTGATLNRGEVGEICVRSPTIMDGYFRMPDATAATIDAGAFLHTGDLGSLDGEGYLRIQGRVRDVIIRGGENIYPAEIEEALSAHPDVAAVVAVGIADEKWGQQVGAAICVRPGADLSTDALEAFARTRLAYFKLPKRWLFVDAFPQTASGKIRKVELEQLFSSAAR